MKSETGGPPVTLALSPHHFITSSPSSGSGPRSVDERLQQWRGRQQVREALVVKFGMPLHADDERSPFAADAFDDAIGRLGIDEQGLAELLHALMMNRIDTRGAQARIERSEPAALAQS